MDDAKLVAWFESLSTEIGTLSQKQDAYQEETRASFQRLEARMDRIGGIVNGGARQMARLVEWSESVDLIIADRDRKIEELVGRVAKLEQGK